MKTKFYSNPARINSLFLCYVFVSLMGQSSSEPANAQWTKHTIDSSIQYHYRSKGYDIDNDGDMDLFVPEYEAGNIIFYENNANVNWTKHIIESKAGLVVGGDLADFDGDGYMDIVADHYGADLVVWYKNTGTTPIQWIKDTIDSSIDGPSGVRVADINGDSAMDVVSKAYDSGEMVWYQNNLPLAWSKHIIGLNVGGSGVFDVADFNNDDIPDVIRSVTQQNKVILYKNNLPDQTWTEVLIDGNLLSTRQARAADIDNDGDLDIVAGAQIGLNGGEDIVWYENEGSGESWIKHIIVSDLQGARGIAVADFDTNGYVDFVATDPAANDVLLFLNENGGKDWIKRTIDDNFTNVNSVFTYDIDLDGDFDIIPSRDATGPLLWYENPLGSAYAVSFEASPFLIQSPDDTLTISAELSNPDNHPVHIFAVLQGDQTDFIDTVQLFDDGLHGDVDSSDNVWGNIRLKTQLPEDAFEVSLTTYDSISGESFDDQTRFITFGPVDFDYYSFDGDDIIPNPGELIKIWLTLKNSSSEATATNMEAILLSHDPWVIVPDFIRSFEDIPAGESSTSDKTFQIKISDECPGDTDIPVIVNIFSYNQICWSDTFSIHVYKHGTNINDVRKQIARIYPNPALNILTIETFNPGQHSIEIASLNGQVLYNGRMEGPVHQIDLSSFQKGLYLITVRSKDFIETRKLIKMQ